MAAAMAQATAARRPHSGKSGASRYGAMLAVLDVADEHEKDNVAPEEVISFLTVPMRVYARVHACARLGSWSDLEPNRAQHKSHCI